jgi:hypothetical protein
VIITIKKDGLLALMLLTSLTVGAQDETCDYNKHSILLKTSIYSFFDQSVLVQTVYGTDDKAYSIGHGIAYTYAFNESAIGLTFDNFYFENIESDLKSGDNYGRKFIKITSQYHRTVFNHSKHSIDMGAGLSYRKGGERIFGSYYQISPIFGETVSISKLLRDVGTSVSIAYRYQLFKNFYISTDIRYTYFVYLKDNEETPYEWDPGPTRNELSFSLGVGYNFGNK